MATKKSAEYDADSVKHLGSREAVQQKTAMYAGSTDEHGLFTCLRETTDNIIDEAINGYCTEGEVVVSKDLEYWVRDNGRGMPIGMMTVIDSVSNRPHKIPAIQAITSLLHAGGKLGDEADSAYKISRGCFTGNTKVRLLNGKTVTFAKLYKRWLKNQTPIDVLTYDLKKHKLVPTKISNVILSKYVTETVTVHTSNGGKIECTPDHKFYTNTDDGKIRPVPAGKLEVGTSLVTTYIKEDMYGYTKQTCLGNWDWVHRIVGSHTVNRDIEMHTEMVHHESRVKTDNRPSNLEVVSRANHTREHLEHLVEHSRNKIMETQADLREDNSVRFTSQNSTDWHKAQAAQTKAINIAVRIMHLDSNGQRDLTKKIYEKTRVANEFSWDTCVKWFGVEEAFLEAARENYEYLASRIKKSYIAEDKLSGNYTKYNVDLKKNSDTARINRFAEALNTCSDPRTATPREFNEAKGDSVFGRYAKLCATSSLKNLKAHVLDGKPFKELLDLNEEDKLQRMIIAEGKVRTRDSLLKSSNRFMGSCKARGIKDLFSPRAVGLYTAAAKDKRVGAQTFLLNLHFLSVVHGEEEDIKTVYSNYNCNVVKVVRRKYSEQIPVFDLTVDNPSHCFFVDTEHDWRNAETHVLVSNSHGIGQKLPNFLSFSFDVFTFSSPKPGTPKYWHSIKYTNGKLTSELAKCEPPVHPVTGKKIAKGTIVKFKLNPKFFTAKSFPPSLLLEYLQTSSYFTPGFTWTLTAAASGKTKTYHSENGALDYITEYKSKLPKVASMKPDSIFICSSPVMDVAVDFTTAEGNHLKGFTNGLFNAEGGDHVDSFFRTLQKSLEPYKKKGKDFTLTEIKEGVLGIVNAKLAAPKFSSQVKVKLQDERAAEPFRKLLQVELDKFFKKNKSLAESICLRCAELKNLRSKFLASKQVVMELRKIAKKGFPVKALMAPKCKASERELYLVEGDSAKGGITGVRNAHFQEVFPLKGKIMNAHRATSAKFFLNEEVLNILAMIGFDPKAADPYSNLRVSKLIFMTDADCDGPMTGNTRVMLCDGTSPTIKKLAEEGRDEFYVWAVDPNGLLVPALARLPSHVKTVNQLYKLTFKDGTTVKCDASHKWFKTGMMDTPVKTPKLKVGDSIQSIYFRESGIRKLDKGERYLQWFDPRTRNYKFVHRRVKEAIDPVKYEKYMEINKGSVGGNVHIHHKDDRPLNNDPTNLKYIRKEKHWGHHGSKMSQDYNGSPKHKEDLARFYKNNPEHKINSAKNITEYNKSQAHRDVVSVMNTDPDILRKQFIGKCARMYAGLVHAKLDPSDHKNWFKYKLVNNKGNAIPSMSYYAMVNLGISLGEVKDYVTEAKIHERMEYTLLKLPEQTVEKKLQTMQDAFCRVGKRLEVDGLELSSENYEKYRTTLSRPSNTPKWEGALASFDGSLSRAKRAVKNFNHTITKIELLDCAPTPVYCMSVPGYKNFLIKDKHGNGIVTGNCHIAVLLLSMVHKYFPELIERGIIYIAEVPEFMAMVKGKPVYADSKEEMEKKLIELKATKAQVSHFKGLAEMESDILGAVGMNPATRMIRQITPTDSPTYNEDFISIVSGDASSRRTLLGI